MGRPKKGAKAPGKGVAIQLRIAPEIAAAIDAECMRLERDQPGHRFTRADVVRACVVRALMPPAKGAK